MAKSLGFGVGLVVVMLAPGPVQAQTQSSGEPAGTGESFLTTVLATIANLVNADDGVLRPTVQLVPAGGGLGIGFDYDPSFRPRGYARVRAMTTSGRAWGAEAGVGYRTSRVHGEVYGRLRDLPRLSFFGPGPASAVSDRASYRLRDHHVGLLGSIHVGRGLWIAGRVETSQSHVASGRSTSVPTIEEVFDEARAPGLTTQPRIGRYEALVRLEVPAVSGYSRSQGGRYRAAYAMFRDHDRGRFSFRRLELEGRHEFAPVPQHRLSLHSWIAASTAGPDQAVPFYLQSTLGGVAQLRSVRTEWTGLEGGQATLRGFSSLRFRDTHVVLMQVEYRIPAWGPIDLATFVEAGTATARAGDVTWSTIKRSHGVGVALRRGADTALRVDVGFGGGEGTRIWVSTAADVLP